MADIETVWRRIECQQGETFRQVRGREFTYAVQGAVLRPCTTNRNLSKATFSKALDRLPVDNTAQLHDLQGPSYLFAVLMDARIRGTDW